jgi:hypothetical protein
MVPATPPKLPASPVVLIRACGRYVQADLGFHLDHPRGDDEEPALEGAIEARAQDWRRSGEKT